MNFIRSGEDAGMIQKNRPYHVVIESTTDQSSQHRQFDMSFSHEELLDLLVCLRYHQEISEQKQQEALEKLSQEATKTLRTPNFTNEELVQIDIVTNARELYALPFEAVLDADSAPLLVNQKNPIVLTRRALKPLSEKKTRWPARPRVLFAYASPTWILGSTVPAEKHKEVLLRALQPWVDPLPGVDMVIGNEKSVITTLKEASLDDIKQAIEQGYKDQKPYTHVHLLAHGMIIKDPLRRHRERFGVALDSADRTVTPPEKIVEAILPKTLNQDRESTNPVMVTLAICDGGNQSNTVVEVGSLAQELHQAGVPIVIASQLPLTFPGSTIIAETLYRQWMDGEDIREGLYQARSNLYRAKNTTYHDWVGMVAYVRLPEGYHDYLLDIRLQSQLAALETTSKYANVLLEQSIKETWQYEQVTKRLQTCIDSLTKYLDQYSSETSSDVKVEIVQETQGLLGSAYKRLSELLFRRAGIEEAEADQRHQEEVEALKNAYQCYKQGFLYNTSHHWNGVQYLALQMVLTGRIEKIGEWYACQVAAERDLSPDCLVQRQVWARGSLAELDLIASISGNLHYNPEITKNRLAELHELVKKNPNNFSGLNPVLSTHRQFARYANWWNKENGFFNDADSDLSGEAKKLLEIFSN